MSQQETCEKAFTSNSMVWEMAQEKPWEKSQEKPWEMPQEMLGDRVEGEKPI